MPASSIAPPPSKYFGNFVSIATQGRRARLRSGASPPPPSHPGGTIALQWRLQMDARPTNSGPLHIPLRDTLPVQTNSDASASRAKVLAHNTTLSFYLKNESVI